MASNKTLSEIRTRVRQRADMEASTDFMPDSEINTYINSAYKELYAMLDQHGMMHTETLQTITADGSTYYALPSDYYATLGVWKDEGNYSRPLKVYGFKDRPFTGPSVTGEAYAYRVTNEYIELYPRPSSGTYYHSYHPVVTELSSDSDTLNGVNGWEEFVVIDAAIKCLMKEESDTRALMMERERIVARIEMEAEQRNMGESLTITNRRKKVYDDPADIWWAKSDD